MRAKVDGITCVGTPEEIARLFKALRTEHMTVNEMRSIDKLRSISRRGFVSDEELRELEGEDGASHMPFPPIAESTTMAQHLAGQTCYGGYFQRKEADEEAFVLLFPPQLFSTWQVLLWHWRPPVATWSMPGRVYNVRGVGADPWTQTVMISPEMGLVTPIRNSMFQLAPAVWQLKGLIGTQRIAYSDMSERPTVIGRLALRADGNGNQRPELQKSAGNIAPQMALIYAMALYQKTEGTKA